MANFDIMIIMAFLGSVYHSDTVYGSTTRATRAAYEKQFRVRYYHVHFKENWRTYGAAGYLYGYESYLQRHHYVQGNLSSPTICFSDEYVKENGTFYESFVCPMANQSDSFYRCCGMSIDNEQYCCTNLERKFYSFWSLSTIIVVLIAMAFAAYKIYQCWKNPQGNLCNWNTTNRRQQRHDRVLVAAVATEQEQELHPYINTPGSTMQNSSQPLLGESKYPLQPIAGSSVPYPNQPPSYMSAPYGHQPASNMSAPYPPQYSPNMSAPYAHQPVPSMPASYPPQYSPNMSTHYAHQPGPAQANMQSTTFSAPSVPTAPPSAPTAPFVGNS